MMKHRINYLHIVGHIDDESYTKLLQTVGFLIEEALILRNTVVIKAFMEGVQDEDILQFVNGFGENQKIEEEVKNLIDIRKNGFKVPSCPDCETCALQEICHYPTWKRTEDCISRYMPNSMDEEFGKFVLQYREVAL